MWRPGSKCALVSAIFVGRLATLHLRHFSTVSGGSPGRERFLHSKLHIPARLAIHSSALARLFSQSSFSASRFTAEQLTNWPNCPMSALCQKRTFAFYSSNSIGALLEKWRYVETERFGSL